MRTMNVAVGCMALALSAGCSSTTSDPFGPAPDFDHVQQEFAAPTGTFAAGSEGAVLSGFSQQKETSANGFALGGSSTGAGTSGPITSKSIRFLDTQAGSTSFCPALESGAESGSCTCPNGGSLVYDMTGMRAMQGYQGGPIDITLKVRANACAVENASLDGTEFAKIKSSGTPSMSDLVMIFDLHLTATANGQTEKIDADFEYDNGKTWFSIGVSDGSVVVSSESWDSSTKSGTVYVRDRNESWTCTFTNGKGTCTSDKGTSRDVQS